jgi:ATP-dependent DNA ligase
MARRGPDGVAIFNALHRRGTVTEAMLYAFDLLKLDGQDLRGLALATSAQREISTAATKSVQY